MRFLSSLALLTLLSTAAQAQPALERGRYLMEGIVACGNCHLARGPQGQPQFDKGLSGGMLFDEPVFKAYAANITPDKATGIGSWSDAQLGRAIREGVRPDGSIIGPPMPVEFYRHMSDADLAAVIAYLRAQPAVRNQVPKSSYQIPLPPSYGAPLRSVQAPPRSDKLRYGEYLAQIGHCMECHTERDARGLPVQARFGAGGMEFKGPWGISVSRNLTSHESGLKLWSDAQIAKAIREGVDRQGQPYKPPMAFPFYKNISDADIDALIAYLRSLPPVPSGSKP